MNIHILLKKVFSNHVYVSSYEIVESLSPGAKGKTLAPGDFVDLAKCEILPEWKEYRVNIYRVTNENGHADEQLLETYGLESNMLPCECCIWKHQQEEANVSDNNTEN